jgi:hypothetical protein
MRGPTSLIGPERHLLRDSNTSEIGGQSGNGRRTLKTSLIGSKQSFWIVSVGISVRASRPRLSRARQWLHATLLDRLGGARGGEERDQSFGVVDLCICGGFTCTSSAVPADVQVSGGCRSNADFLEA